MIPFPYSPYVPQQQCRETFECGRCFAEVTSATRREMEADGWQFHPITEKVTSENKGLAKGKLTKEVVKGEFVLCGDCAPVLTALWRIEA